MTTLLAVIVGCLVLMLKSHHSMAEVLTLTDASFSGNVSTDLWLVEFYAPWCGHCKKLAPVLDALAKEVTSPTTKIGKIDATKNRETALAHNVTAFPTLLYFNGKKNGKYEGPRTKEGMKLFLDKLASPNVLRVSSEKELESMFETHEVVFVLELPASISSEIRERWHQLFDELAENMHMEATFAVMPDSERSLPSVISQREKGHKPRALDAQLSSLPSLESLTRFVREHNRKLISRLESHNFKRLGSLDKPLIMLALDYSSKSSESLTDLFAKTVVELPVELERSFVFGQIDGKKFSKFLRQYEAKSFPALLLLDVAKELYNVVPFSFVSATQDEASVRAVVTSMIQSYKDGSLDLTHRAPQSIKDMIIRKLQDYYPYSLLCLVPFILILVSLVMPTPAQKEKQS